MKRLFIAGFSVLALSFNAFSNCPTLSGDYTIGGPSADFSTFTKAVEALECGGIAAPVSFKVNAGSYVEQVTIGAIQGTSDFNTVTFTSASGNASDVNLSFSSYASNANYTLGLIDANQVIIKDLTITAKGAAYGTAVKFSGASNNALDGVVLNGATYQTTGLGNAVIMGAENGNNNDNAVRNSEINNGSYGAAFLGSNQSERGVQLTGNIFFNQYETALMVRNQSSPIVSDNVVTSNSEYGYYNGIVMENCSDELLVSNNIVNIIKGQNGIELASCNGSDAGYGVVSNNSVTLGNSVTATGIAMTGTTDYQVLNFNRIKFDGADQNSVVTYYSNESFGGNINLVNNIMFNLENGGYTIIGNTFRKYSETATGLDKNIYSADANVVTFMQVRN